MLYRTTGEGGSLRSPGRLRRPAPPSAGPPGAPAPGPPGGSLRSPPRLRRPVGGSPPCGGSPRTPSVDDALALPTSTKHAFLLSWPYTTQQKNVLLSWWAWRPRRSGPRRPWRRRRLRRGRLLLCSGAPGLPASRGAGPRAAGPPPPPTGGGSGPPALSLARIARACPVRRPYLSRRAIPAPPWIARPLGPSYPDRGGRRTRRKMVDFIERLCYYRDCKGDPQPSALRCPNDRDGWGPFSFFVP